MSDSLIVQHREANGGVHRQFIKSQSSTQIGLEMKITTLSDQVSDPALYAEEIREKQKNGVYYTFTFEEKMPISIWSYWLKVAKHQAKHRLGLDGTA